MRNPDRARFHAVGHPLATSVPFVVPPYRGSGLVAKVRSLPSARGPGSSVEVAAGPGARRGMWGSAPGQRRISIHHATTKQRYQSVVCRFLDAFDKDVGGVSAVQHSAHRHVRVICQMSFSMVSVYASLRIVGATACAVRNRSPEKPSEHRRWRLLP
jgi:hypothetical protein